MVKIMMPTLKRLPLWWNHGHPWPFVAIHGHPWPPQLAICAPRTSRYVHWCLRAAQCNWQCHAEHHHPRGRCTCQHYANTVCILFGKMLSNCIVLTKTTGTVPTLCQKCFPKMCSNCIFQMWSTFWWCHLPKICYACAFCSLLKPVCLLTMWSCLSCLSCWCVNQKCTTKMIIKWCWGSAWL